MDRAVSIAEKRKIAEQIWTTAFIKGLKKSSPKKAAKRADLAVLHFDRRWGS